MLFVHIVTLDELEHCGKVFPVGEDVCFKFKTHVRLGNPTGLFVTHPHLFHGYAKLGQQGPRVDDM